MGVQALTIKPVGELKSTGSQWVDVRIGLQQKRIKAMSKKIVSLFSGAGGLDLGFHNAGFATVWANEYDKTIWDTFRHNFPNTTLETRSITDVAAEEVPDCDGVIGGPPCQSWSEAGAGRGIADARGQLFNDYIRILRAKKPKFFLVENVSGILAPKHAESFKGFLKDFEDAGYSVNWKLVNAHDYGVPEDRLRVIIIGFRNDLKKTFQFPEPQIVKPTLKDAIGDLPEAAPAIDKNKTNGELAIPNHEYMTGGFSPIFLSRNRVRSWDEPSFTIQAGGRQAPLHPRAPKMVKVEKNKQVFVEGKEHLYRRLSVRECARIQTFPDNYTFLYRDVANGYKMIGNAVPVKLAEALAKQIMNQLGE
jgi:DNA (cytosine-5)-methyltransferase 1